MTDIQERPSNFPWPPLIYIGGIAASILLHFLYELPWFGHPLVDILFAIGWLFVLSGLALLVTALRALRAAKTTALPNKAASHLVTGSAFSLTRNPIYLADTVVMIGIGLIAGMAWFLILAIVASFLTQKVAIEPEERHLESRFGKKYRDYAKKVRRWI